VTPVPDTTAPDDAAPDAVEEARFGRRVVVVFAVQIVTLAALYWFGRHFA
jgi:hypothetical protein